jgi:uncharacterized membrane protein YfcA
MVNGVYFPSFDYPLSIPGLILLGVLVGVMTGFWGMGGRFLLTPLLNIFLNIPFNVAIGSDVCQMVGTSSMNMVRYKILGTVDFKLACWVTLGGILGMECGVSLLEFLKRAGDLIILGQSLRIIFLSLSVIYAILLFWIGTILYRESKGTRQPAAGALTDFQLGMTSRLQTIRLSPMISLPRSGGASLSLWLVLAIGFLTGLLVGFLGVGGTFFVLPALIYVLGCPMGVARSTELLATLFLMVYGTFSHSLRGNVDLQLAVVLFLTNTLGIQIVTLSIKKFPGRELRRIFPLVVYAIVFFLALKILGRLGLVPF